MAVAGCGGSSNKQAASQVVRGPGFVFRAPAGWHAEEGLRGATAYPAKDAPELVSATRFPLVKRFRPSLWPKVVGELDRAAGQLGALESRETVRIAGLRGRRYEMPVTSGGRSLHQRIVFLLTGKTEYQLLCRWAGSAEAPEACTMLESSFRPV